MVAETGSSEVLQVLPRETPGNSEIFHKTENYFRNITKMIFSFPSILPQANLPRRYTEHLVSQNTGKRSVYEILILNQALMRVNVVFI